MTLIPKYLSIGSRIVSIRTITHLTQSKFAESLGISRPALSAIESGITKPSMPILYVIEFKYNYRHEWVLSGDGEMYKDSLAASAILSVTDSKKSDGEIDKIKISEDLCLARRVLKSGTGYATALHLNIRSFADAVDEKERMTALETKQCDFEIKMSEEIKNLKSNFESLQAENRTLRTENNRLKSTYEGPNGDNGHLTTDTEKKAM